MNSGNQTVSDSLVDWPLACRIAAGRLRIAFARHAELTPPTVARVALKVLPRPIAARWLRAIRSRGWLDPSTRLTPERIAATPWPPEQRPLLELALFGGLGQGSQRESAHRDEVFQRLCAEVRSHLRDFADLAAASERVLNDPSVRADAELRGMLRTYIAQRQAELHNRRTEEVRSVNAQNQVQSDARRDETLSKRLVDSEVYRRSVAAARNQFTDLRLRFEDRLAHYDAQGARHVYEEIRELARCNQGLIDEVALGHFDDKVTRVDSRAHEFRAQLESLAREGREAARKGDSDRALWIARRLAAVHDMLPEVLPESRFKQLHEAVMSAIRDDEHREALEEILNFERVIAREIKELAGRIHRFHEISRREPHDGPLYQQARREFDDCVRAVLQRDEAWLASLMLKLDTLVDDLEEERDRASHQVERFLENVRTALIRIRKEVIAIREEHKQARSNPPPTGQ